MRRFLVFALIVSGIASLLMAAANLPSAAQEAGDGEGGWVLEFGPYIGYYDFDAVTEFVDRGLFGARASVHASDAILFEAEFDEVYTRRDISDNGARQISLALHARYEPLSSRFSPSLLGGVAFVGLDDTDDPDAYGEALDVGLGVRFRATPRWMLRAEWMLRRQRFRLYEVVESEGVLPIESDAQSVWGRGFRVGASYVF